MGLRGRPGLRGLPVLQAVGGDVVCEAEGHVFSTESSGLEGLCGRRDAGGPGVARTARGRVYRGARGRPGRRWRAGALVFEERDEFHRITYGQREVQEKGLDSVKLQPGVRPRRREVMCEGRGNRGPRGRRAARRDQNFAIQLYSPQKARRPRLRRRVVAKGGLRRPGDGSCQSVRATPTEEARQGRLAPPEEDAAGRGRARGRQGARGHRETVFR